ncbi:hypothetical protein [Endozoicomonas sp.]|uniref:hypothetical protein n=1 Tax=Endozoicomonas sp. TaxID=1892382 RepID=UPI0028845B29|nr:hypothetical protein [Endozoicomonas sp.]
MFNFERSAAANQSEALRKIDQGTAAHNKKEVPKTMSNGYNRVASYFGKGVSIALHVSTNHNQVRSLEAAVMWGKEGYFSKTVSNNAKTMKDFVVCASCGEQTKLQPGDTPYKSPASERHSQKCDRQQLAASATSELSLLLPTTPQKP